MIQRRATLLVDKKFEGGFSLKKGTPIFVEEWPSGWTGSFYPDPTKHSSHSFALDRSEFSFWVRGETGEEYLVVAEEDPPDPEEAARIRAWEINRAQKTVDYCTKRLGEATAALEALLYNKEDA